MPTALIADDEPHLAAYLETSLAKAWPELRIVAVARNGVEAAERIAALQPDFAFLDIKMPGLTGLEVAQGIEGATRVVFVTAYDEYAVAAFEQHAHDYVLKPVKAERLARTVARLQGALAPTDGDASLAEVLERLLAAARPLERLAAPPSSDRLLAAAPAAQRHLRHVRASQGEFMHQVDVKDVLFFRADDKYTCVQTARGEHLIRTPIAELAAQLDPSSFAQIHRSTLVNLDHVAGTRRDELSRLFVRLHGHGAELPVSRAYVHLFKSM